MPWATEATAITILRRYTWKLQIGHPDHMKVLPHHYFDAAGSKNMAGSGVGQQADAGRCVPVTLPPGRRVSGSQLSQRESPPSERRRSERGVLSREKRSSKSDKSDSCFDEMVSKTGLFWPFWQNACPSREKRSSKSDKSDSCFDEMVSKTGLFWPFWQNACPRKFVRKLNATHGLGASLEAIGQRDNAVLSPTVKHQMCLRWGVQESPTYQSCCTSVLSLRGSTKMGRVLKYRQQLQLEFVLTYEHLPVNNKVGQKTDICAQVVRFLLHLINFDATFIQLVEIFAHNIFCLAEV
eukprot:gene7174-biopygen2513